MKHSATRVVRTRTALLLWLVAGAGCGDSTEPDPSPLGAYTLRSIATLPLPFRLVDFGNGEFEEVTGGAVELNDDATFVRTTASRSTLGGTTSTVVHSDSGSYAIAGSTITLTSTSEAALSGTLLGDTLTVQIDRLPWAYVR